MFVILQGSVSVYQRFATERSVRSKTKVVVNIGASTCTRAPHMHAHTTLAAKVEDDSEEATSLSRFAQLQRALKVQLRPSQIPLCEPLCAYVCVSVWMCVCVRVMCSGGGFAQSPRHTDTSALQQHQRSDGRWFQSEGTRHKAHAMLSIAPVAGWSTGCRGGPRTVQAWPYSTRIAERAAANPKSTICAVLCAVLRWDSVVSCVI